MTPRSGVFAGPSLGRILLDLRADALAKGMTELAVTYGWSLLRMQNESLDIRLRQAIINRDKKVRNEDKARNR